MQSASWQLSGKFIRFRKAVRKTTEETNGDEVQENGDAFEFDHNESGDFQGEG